MLGLWRKEVAEWKSTVGSHPPVINTEFPHVVPSSTLVLIT